MSPNAITSAFLGMFVQSIPGAVGTGMMTMIVYVILTLFIVGLMVGKTPEFMSMKISPRDIKLSVFIFLVHPALILIPTVIAFTTGNVQQLITDGDQVSPFSYTQALYEFASARTKQRLRLLWSISRYTILEYDYRTGNAIGKICSNRPNANYSRLFYNQR